MTCVCCSLGSPRLRKNECHSSPHGHSCDVYDHRTYASSRRAGKKSLSFMAGFPGPLSRPSSSTKKSNQGLENVVLTAPWHSRTYSILWHRRRWQQLVRSMFHSEVRCGPLVGERSLLWRGILRSFDTPPNESPAAEAYARTDPNTHNPPNFFPIVGRFSF